MLTTSPPPRPAPIGQQLAVSSTILPVATDSGPFPGRCRSAADRNAMTATILGRYRHGL